ncbi:unnamed protein product [Fructobacillus evanidus]|nr:unnamed protein product [Fructobacillus sp. LMG 32999]
MKINKKQKWVIAVSVVVYVLVIWAHISDINDPGSINYKGNHVTKSERN